MNEFNGNGDGHQKAFELTQPKTPEQIKREALNSMMPQLRRNCSQDHRLKKSVGAKWLFSALTDNSFMNKFGGDGWGRVYCSLKDLRRLYGHDEDTIAVWRDKLIETGWIWFQNRWPKCCWGISGACNQPELPLAGQEYMAIMAKTSARGQPPLAVGSEEIEKTDNSGANGLETRLDQPPTAVAPTANGGRSDRTVRSHQPPTAVTVTADSRSHQPPTAVAPTADGGHTGSKSPVCPTADGGHIRETPALNSLGGRETIKRSTGLNARNGSGGAKKISVENLFLHDVGAMMEAWKKGSSEYELDNSGGWWRKSYRANHDLIQRVLAEVRCMIREGKIKTTPGATAVDLWKRWSLPTLQKKAAAGTAAH